MKFNLTTKLMSLKSLTRLKMTRGRALTWTRWESVDRRQSNMARVGLKLLLMCMMR